MPTKKTQTIALYFSVIIMAIASIFWVNGLILAWTAPTAVPPAGNVAAPLNVGSTGQSKAGGLILNTGGAATGLIVNSGNVGIGTAAPEQKLHIQGNVQIGQIGQSVSLLSLSNQQVISLPATSGNTQVTNLLSLSGPQNGRLYVGVYGANNGVWFQNSNSGVLSVNYPLLLNPNGGNVGIGTAAPGAKLHVAGTAGVDGIMFPDGTLQTTAGGASWSSEQTGCYEVYTGAWNTWVACNAGYVVTAVWFAGVGITHGHVRCCKIR